MAVVMPVMRVVVAALVRLLVVPAVKRLGYGEHLRLAQTLWRWARIALFLVAMAVVAVVWLGSGTPFAR